MMSLEDQVALMNVRISNSSKNIDGLKTFNCYSIGLSKGGDNPDFKNGLLVLLCRVLR